MMDRKVAERQRLQQQLNEKDRKESELSTERYELERKWRDRLRMKEVELKQEQIDLQRRSGTDYRDSVAARISGLISRSSDDLSMERTPKRYAYPETNNQQSLNRHYLQREARTSTTPYEPAMNLSEYTHFEPYEVERSVQYYSRGLSSKRDLGFKQLPDEVPGRGFRNGLEHSSDDDLESLGFSNHADAVSVDMDDKFESDIDSYTPPSGDKLTGMEKSWERNLEEELKQISAGTLRVFPSGKVNTARDTALDSRKITRTQSDLSSRPYTSRSYQSPMETGFPGTFERSRREDRLPRSSTAIPGEEHEWLNRNGSMNVSEISTVLPTLLKGITKRRETKKYDHNNSPLKYRDSFTQGDHEFPRYVLTKDSTSKDQAVNSTSPNSSKSEPITRTDFRNKKSLSMDQGASNTQADRSAVYLLNMDDYIDRHQVLSSDVVASLRDLSPSEKYSYS